MIRHLFLLFILFSLTAFFISGISVAEGEIESVEITNLNVNSNNNIFVEYKLKGSPPTEYNGRITPMVSGTSVTTGTLVCGKLSESTQKYTHIVKPTSDDNSYVVNVNINGVSDSAIINKNMSENISYNDSKTSIGDEDVCFDKPNLRMVESEKDSNNSEDNYITKEKVDNPILVWRLFRILFLFWTLVALIVTVIVKLF
jgi:hypothetical protein